MRSDRAPAYRGSVLHFDALRLIRSAALRSFGHGWGLLKEVWGIQRRINCATNCNTKDPGSVAGVGDLHLSIIEDVIKPAQGCQTVVTMFQNGQLVVLASCVMTWAMNWAVKWAETLE